MRAERTDACKRQMCSCCSNVTSVISIFDSLIPIYWSHQSGNHETANGRIKNNVQIKNKWTQWQTMAPYTPGNYRWWTILVSWDERGHCGSSTYTSGIVMLLLNDANIICNENRVGYLCMHKQNTYKTYINMNHLQNKNEPNILTAKDVFSLIIVFFIINRYKIFWIWWVGNDAQEKL